MIPSGYRRIADIVHTSGGLVVRAERIADATPVVIKMVTEEADSATRERLRNHIRIGRHLSIQGIPRVLEATESDSGYVVMNDVGVQTLADRIRLGAIPIEDALTIAKQISNTLAELHTARFIHRDVAPQNIVLAERSMQAFLVDLGLAAQLNESGEFEQHRDGAAGTYAYMAPEQSGRMDRNTDARADLYALGCVLFSMLTGQPPFRSENTAALLHAHTARQAPHVRDLREDVPEVVDAMIDLLLRKDPDDRYQSAEGLTKDIERILSHITTGTQPLLQLRTDDASGRFRLPDILVDRDVEVERIVSAATDVRRSGVHICLVSGGAGVGKSSVVQRALSKLSAEGARVYVGTHERFRDGQPLVGVLRAYREVLRAILALPAAEIEEWRGRYRQALGSSAGLLAESLPELRHLLGDIPPTPDLPAAEARARFLSVMERLATAVDPNARQYTFVLEDLQWADDLTFELLQSVAASEAISGISVIATIRDDDEVGARARDKFLAMLAEVGEYPVHVTLTPMSVNGVAEYISSTLLWSVADSKPLAQVLVNQTSGNPLAVREALLRLHRDEVLTFDHDRREWIGNVSSAAGIAFENVTDLIADRLHALDVATKHALGHAACVGVIFDPDLASAVSDTPREQFVDALRILVDQSIVFPLGDGRYSFVHDRVHQSSLNLLGVERRTSVHRRIHDHLLRWLTPAEQREQLFDLVEHGNDARNLFTTENDKLNLAQLNLEAATRSRASAAFDASIGFLRVALSLLGERGWESDRDVMFPATLLLAECLSHERQKQEAIELLNKALERSITPFDKAEALYHRLVFETHHGDMGVAIDYALQALEHLGIKLPAHPNTGHTIKALAAARIAQGRRDPDAFATEGHLTDERIRLALRILDMSATGAYYRSTNMISVVYLTRTRLVFKYGHDAESVDAFGHYGMILTLSGAIKLGARFGDLAMKLARHYGNARSTTRAFFVNAATTIHWTRDMSKTMDALIVSAEQALEAGDGTYYAYSMGHEIQNLLYMGLSIDDIKTRVDERWTVLRRLYPLDVEPPTVVTLFKHQFDRLHAGLKGLARLNHDLDGDGFSHEAHTRALIDTRNAAGSAEWYWKLITVAVLGGSTERVLVYDKALEPYRFATTGQPFSIDLAYLVALAHADLIHRDLHPSPAEGKKKIKQALSKIKGWAKHSPAVTSRLHFVQGLQLFVQDDMNGAREAFIECLSVARESQDLLRIAQSSEWIANTLERSHLDEASHAYQALAVSSYQTFGATIAANRLKGVGEETDQESHSSDFTTITTHQTTHEVDLDLVLRASAAIAGEIRLEGLLHTLLTLVLQHAGAQRAVLMLRRNGQLIVTAEADSDDHVQLHNEPIDSGSIPVCVSAVQYANRTQEPLVLNDAMATTPYSSDPDIRQRHVRSLMVLPLSNQGKPLGVMYLENRLTTHAFTSERSGVIRLLVGHMAIALENANLYDQQRDTLNAAARFIPTEFLDSLGIRSIRDVGLGDAVNVQMTVLFADIRRFTTLSEQLSVDQTFAFLNEFLAAVTPSIRSHRGFIDKYVGDAIMALFPESPDDAVSAALEILDALRRYNKQREQRGDLEIEIGIGIHYGEVMLGTVGTEDRMDTTVIGDTVNIAARLEELTKSLGSVIYISDSVRNGLKPSFDAEITPRGMEQIRGRENALQIHEVIARKSK